MTSDSANAETQAPMTMDVRVRACGIGSTNFAAPSVNIGVKVTISIANGNKYINLFLNQLFYN